MRVKGVIGKKKVIGLSGQVQYTTELARAERRRAESEGAARKAEEGQRAAEEQVALSFVFGADSYL